VKNASSCCEPSYEELKRISNTKIGNPEREALLGILDKLTELKGKYIIEKYGRNKP
jgi:hypothetical protein